MCQCRVRFSGKRPTDHTAASQPFIAYHRNPCPALFPGQLRSNPLIRTHFTTTAQTRQLLKLMLVESWALTLPLPFDFIHIKWDDAVVSLDGATSDKSIPSMAVVNQITFTLGCHIKASSCLVLGKSFGVGYVISMKVQKTALGLSVNIPARTICIQ